MSTFSLDTQLRRLRLEPSMPVPLHRQLRDQLRSVVLELEPNTRMPSESDLMAIAKVSRATARRAITDLMNEGLLISKQGVGTFVSDRKVTAELGRPSGFSETMNRLGRNPSTVVTSLSETPATSFMAGRLGVDVGDAIYCIERIRNLDGEPCMFECATLASSLVPGLIGHDLTGSLYELLRESYGLIPAWGTETIGSQNADEQLSEMLNVRRGTSLIVTERATSSQTGAPLEYTRRYARPDLVSFVIQLSGSSEVLAAGSVVEFAN